MKYNNYEKMLIGILGDDFCVNSLKLNEFEKWQSEWLCIKHIGLFVDDEMFINDDAKKIFVNILINGCEFEEKIHFSKVYYPNIIIDTREINYLECLDKIKLIQMMIERANEISETINNSQVNIKIEQGLVSKYKALINGFKSNYEKGLILVKLFFKDVSDNDLLFKYYQLIQNKEDFETRKKIFYEMLFTEENKVIENVTETNKRLIKSDRLDRK